MADIDPNPMIPDFDGVVAEICGCVPGQLSPVEPSEPPPVTHLDYYLFQNAIACCLNRCQCPVMRERLVALASIGPLDYYGFNNTVTRFNEIVAMNRITSGNGKKPAFPWIRNTLFIAPQQFPPSCTGIGCTCYLVIQLNQNVRAFLAQSRSSDCTHDHSCPKAGDRHDVSSDATPVSPRRVH